MKSRAQKKTQFLNKPLGKEGCHMIAPLVYDVVGSLAHWNRMAASATGTTSPMWLTTKRWPRRRGRGHSLHKQRLTGHRASDEVEAEEEVGQPPHPMWHHAGRSRSWEGPNGVSFHL